MDLLSHPFRLVGSQPAHVADGSDDAAAEAIAAAILTRRGERELVPDLGTDDPAFAGVDAAQINGLLARYGPDVRVTTVETVHLTELAARTLVTFEDA